MFSDIAVPVGSYQSANDKYTWLVRYGETILERSNKQNLNLSRAKRYSESL